MTKEKRKVVGWIGKLVVIRDLLNCWVLKPDPLAPGVAVVVVSLMVDVAVLLAGEDRLGEEGQDPVEVHQLKPVLLQLVTRANCPALSIHS